MATNQLLPRPEEARWAYQQEFILCNETVPIAIDMVNERLDLFFWNDDAHALEHVWYTSPWDSFSTVSELIVYRSQLLCNRRLLLRFDAFQVSLPPGPKACDAR